MKRKIGTALMILAVLLFSGCARVQDPINAVTREDGSGTRSAFTELFEIIEKTDDGKKLDKTDPKIEVTNSTAVVMLTVSEDQNALGYISMGSLNDSVKAIDIDGVKPEPENVLNNTYPVARPFIIVYKDNGDANIEDFIRFIDSSDGQKIVSDMGYVPVVENPELYTAASKSGKITISGSSSVTPVMQALKEEYEELNPGMVIELQQSDSTTGITAAVEGVSDIGMSSREIKDGELEGDMKSHTIARDGLAIIVNDQNPITNLTKEQVKEIYTGQVKTWSELEKED